MSHDLPIFFIHSGYQEYLKLTIAQAEKRNRSVFLLGDESNRVVSKNWVNMTDYLSNAWQDFQNAYIHMSSNPYIFELNCFRRFFASYELAKSLQIDAFVMMDSDCFAFANFSELNFDSYDVGLSIPENQDNYIWTASPHGSYWTLPALKDFLEYLIHIYTQDLRKLEEKWTFHKQHNIQGGICDMTLLYLWATANRGIRVLNTTLGLENGIFDHFLSVTEGYSAGEFPVRHFCQIKHIRFQNGNAYLKRYDGRWIRSYTIHAQGKSKIYISLIAKQASQPFLYFIAKSTNIALRICNKLWRLLQWKD